MVSFIWKKEDCTFNAPLFIDGMVVVTISKSPTSTGHLPHRWSSELYSFWSMIDDMESSDVLSPALQLSYVSVGITLITFVRILPWKERFLARSSEAFWRQLHFLTNSQRHVLVLFNSQCLHSDIIAFLQLRKENAERKFVPNPITWC